MCNDAHPDGLAILSILKTPSAQEAVAKSAGNAFFPTAIAGPPRRVFDLSWNSTGLSEISKLILVEARI